MTFPTFYLAALLKGQRYAVNLAARRGLQGPDIVRLIQRTEQRRRAARAVA